jgi:hypothetical protein
MVTARTSVMWRGTAACPVRSCSYVTAAACLNNSEGFKFHRAALPCCLLRDIKSTAWGEVQTWQTTTGWTDVVKIIQTELKNKERGSIWLTRAITFITTVSNVAFPTVLGGLSVKPYRLQICYSFLRWILWSVVIFHLHIQQVIMSIVHTGERKHICTFFVYTTFFCTIWGFHCGDYEEWRLLGCFAVSLL